MTPRRESSAVVSLEADYLHRKPARHRASRVPGRTALSGRLSAVNQAGRLYNHSETISESARDSVFDGTQRQFCRKVVGRLEFAGSCSLIGV